MLVVHLPVTSKLVSDLFNYVGAKASDAWHVRLLVNLMRCQVAMSGCWSNRLYYMLQRSPAVSGKLRKVYDVNYGQVMFSDIGTGDADQQSACSR